MELIRTIALLCQIFISDTNPDIIMKAQRACQAELIVCTRDLGRILIEKGLNKEQNDMAALKLCLVLEQK